MAGTMAGTLAGTLAGAASMIAGRAAAACRMGEVLALDRPAGLASMAVAINGRTARLLLDTGAERSLLTLDAVKRLGLKLDPWVGSRLRGAGGRLEEHQNATLERLTLGSITLGRSLSLSVSQSLVVPEADGLLGGDLLRGWDIDLDLPTGHVTLLDPACPAPGTTMPLTLLRRSALLAPVTLDGRTLTALLDTGASISLLNARGMHRMGLTPEQLARDAASPSMAIGGVFTPRRHMFQRLTLGPLALTQPSLFVTDTPNPAYDMLIGLDILERRRLRIGFAPPRLVFAG